MAIRPIIGISCAGQQPTDAPPRVQLNVAYERAIRLAGGTPILIAPGLDAESIQQVTALMDGLLLPGGVDVDPARYHEERHPTTVVNDDLDALEFALLEAATARNLPVLAICRGCQVLNVAHGGSLWQDLPSQQPSDLVHAQRGVARNYLAHGVGLESTSKLATILGSDSLPVNSFHHQSVKAVGQGLTVVGKADDGTIEAIEATDPHSAFRIGIQCHPEGLIDSHPIWNRLFSAFVKAAAS